jgi:hypothetical protein
MSSSQRRKTSWIGARATEQLLHSPICERVSFEQLSKRGSAVVKALSYKPEGHGFETRRGEWIVFNLPNPSDRTRPWGLLGLY